MRRRNFEPRRPPSPPSGRHIRWRDSGLKPSAIAVLWRVSIRTAQLGLARVRAYEEWMGFKVESGRVPPLELMFGCLPHVPGGPCPHEADWCSKEHPFVCSQCHESFYDRHPDMWPDPATDPARVGTLPPRVEHEIDEDPTLTRKQKRAIIARWKEETYLYEEGQEADLGVDLRELIARSEEIPAVTA